jgi:hypothetical protein
MGAGYFERNYVLATSLLQRHWAVKDIPAIWSSDISSWLEDIKRLNDQELCYAGCVVRASHRIQIFA